MSLAVDVAIGAAERLERTAGPGAGLALFRRLASSASGAELRGRAILGGLRCAIALRELGAVRDLSLLWRTVDAGAWPGVLATCKAMVRAGLGVAAIDLADAEVRRMRSARALYMLARCLDVAGDARAAGAFREALEQAETEGARSLAHAARVRCAAWLAMSPETLSEAVEEAKKVVSAEATPAERLILARILLRAPSRFSRASALGMLDELVTGSPLLASDQGPRLGPLARRALVLAARHADAMADGLTPLEVDRLLAVFSREPIAKQAVPVREAIHALARLARAQESKSEADLDVALGEAAQRDPVLAALHRRARDILAGRFEPAAGAHALVLRPGAGETGARAHWSAMLDVAAALRDRAWPRAARALEALAEVAQRGEPLPPQVWTLAQAALGAEEDEVRAAGGRVASVMMRTTTSAPPRGWLGLAHALAVAGMEELATHARRSAALAREPGAAEALALALTRTAWQLAEGGERSRAIARLREARALAPPPGPSPSPAPATAKSSSSPDGHGPPPAAGAIRST